MLYYTPQAGGCTYKRLMRVEIKNDDNRPEILVDGQMVAYFGDDGVFVTGGAWLQDVGLKLYVN